MSQHVEQQDSVYNAGAVGAYVLTGELGWGVISAISQPIWFAEGEAVMTETLPHSRRGRIWVYWQQHCPLRSRATIQLSPIRIRIIQNRHPDHYRIGWIMTDYGI